MVGKGDPRVVTGQDQISVLIHTFNSEKTLPALLRSVAWSDELIAIDMSSSDSTRNILEQYGAIVREIPRSNWNDSLRNDWLSLPKSRWTLVLDADEFLAEGAESELRELVASAPETATAASLPRFNYCFGRVLTGKRWYPDPQIRLFRTNSVRYSSQHPPPPVVLGEGTMLDGPLRERPHIHHQHYSSLRDFAERQVRYSLTDDYSGPLDFGKYCSDALQALLDSRECPTSEERSMEIILAHNHLLRALLHWEQQGRDVPLPAGFGWQLSPRIETQKEESVVGGPEPQPVNWVGAVLRRARQMLASLSRGSR